MVIVTSLIALVKQLHHIVIVTTEHVNFRLAKTRRWAVFSMELEETGLTRLVTLNYVYTCILRERETTKWPQLKSIQTKKGH